MINIQRPNSDSWSIVLGSPSAVTAPGDGVTAYLGALLQLSGASTIQSMMIPRACVIHRVDIIQIVLGTLGTTEPYSAWVRVNDSTDTLISNGLVADAVRNVTTNSAMNLALAEGDSIQIKLTNPTWSTNPTTVYTSAEVFFR